MIYRSNLTAPDLRPLFKLHSPSQLIMGHEAPSDPDFEPGCTWWTDDEAAILYNVARQVGGNWLDLGARLGWTAAHIFRAGCKVVAVEREYGADSNLLARAVDTFLKLDAISNTNPAAIIPAWDTAQEVLNHPMAPKYDGFVIDADHDPPQPLLDAQGCHRIAKPDAVILMHDFMGRPIQDGVRWLMENGWRCRIYDTPNGVALLWRGFRDCRVVHDIELSKHSNCFHVPFHVPDPAIDWAEIRQRIARDEGFPYEKTE